MLVILGYLVVLGTVFGGYMIVGGHLGALYQPAEFLIIGGLVWGPLSSATTVKQSNPRYALFPN